MAQLRPERRPLHRPGQRRQPEGRRTRHARRRAARMAGEGRQAAEEQHADRRVRAHSAVVGLSRMGMGHRRQRARLVVSEAVRIGVGAQRPHSSGDAEGRRARDVSHRDVDRVSAARARHRAVAGADESRGRSAAEGARALAHVVPRRSNHPIAITDLPLEAETTSCRHGTTSSSTTSASRRRPHPSPVGTTVTWTNRDDVPHNIVSTEQEIQVAGARYRRAVLTSIRRAGHLQVLLLASSEDDRARSWSANTNRRC